MGKVDEKTIPILKIKMKIYLILLITSNSKNTIFHITEFLKITNIYKLVFS